LKADALEFSDFLTKLFALGRIVQGIVKDPSRAANAHGGHRDPCGIEPSIHNLKAAIHLAKHLCLWQAAVIEF